MKEFLLKFLAERFAERSSAVGLTAIVGSGYALYDALEAVPHDQKVVTAATVGLIYGFVSFLLKDGSIKPPAQK